MAREQGTAWKNRQLERLQRELETLESVNLATIEGLEKKLGSVKTISIEKETGGLSKMESIEIYTMEKLPPLSESIRQLKPAELLKNNE